MAFRLTRLIQLGAAYAGLASNLRAQLRDPAGATVGSAISTGFVELGTASPTDPGAYIWDYAAYPDAFRGTVDIYKNSDSQWLVGFSVNPEEVAIAGAVLSAADLAAIADKLLGRNHEGGADGGRTVAESLGFLRNKKTITGSANPYTLNVYRGNDTTLWWQAVVTTKAGNPVDSVDPG